MVPNGFDGDRWDYYYYIKVGRKWEANTSKLMVLFKDDKVDQIVRDGRIEPPKQPDPRQSCCPTHRAATAAESRRKPDSRRTQTTPVVEPRP